MSTSLIDISKTFSLPIDFLAKMKKEGLIGEVVEDKEIPWFVLLGQIWGRPEYIKMQIKGLGEKEKTLIKEEKPKPVDAYILKVYTNKKRGQKISVMDLMIAIRQKFGLAINDNMRSKIEKIRKQVENNKKYLAKKT